MSTIAATSPAEILVRAKVRNPDNWSELGSSAKDLWQERQLRDIAKRKVPLDVWLLFDAPEDEEASHEANIFYTEDGTFSAQWYHNAVGLVSARRFETYAEAAQWLTDGGYQDFSS